MPPTLDDSIIVFEPVLSNEKYCPGIMPLNKLEELTFLLTAIGIWALSEIFFKETLISAFGKIKYIVAPKSKNPLTTKKDIACLPGHLTVGRRDSLL